VDLSPTSRPKASQRAKLEGRGMRTFDLSKVVADVEELVKDRPDFVYREPLGEGSCVYQHEGMPSCLWGHWMVMNNIPLPEDYTTNTSTIDDRIVETYLEKHGIQMTNDAVRFMGSVQQSQDDKIPWGDAVSNAKRFYDPSE